MGRATVNFLGKVKYNLISITKSIREHTQMTDTKHIRRNFYSVTWVMPKGWDFGGLGVPRGQIFFFFKHGHVAYQIDRDDEQNRMQVKFSSMGQTGDLGVKSSNIIKFWLPCKFQRFLYQTSCVFSQIEDRKHIEKNFHSVALVMPQGWDLWVLVGVKNFIRRPIDCAL